MKICLITPPSPFLLDERVFMSLGILKVGASLGLAGHAVDHLDLSGVSNYEAAVSEYAGSPTNGASIFALTATTPQMPAAVSVGRILREMGRRVILGGPHVTLVNAARRKPNASTRSLAAWDTLVGDFDVLVAGDGEQAIHQAITMTRGLVDADNPASPLWLTSKGFTDSPWPDRRLVDVETYHYSIEGERALHLVAQLGCLAKDTPIMLSSGIQLPIQDVQKGDVVRCFSVEEKAFRDVPIAATWKREADDLWELVWNDGRKLMITGEHPIYTDRGWVTVDAIEVGTRAASLPAMRKDEDLSRKPAGKVLLQAVSVGVAEDSRQRSMDEGWAKGHAGKIRSHDQGGAPSLLQPSAREYPANQEAYSGLQDRGSQSDEAPGGGGQGFSHNQKEMGQLLFRTDEEKLGEGIYTSGLRTWCDECIPEQVGRDIAKDFSETFSIVSVCREQRILDRPVRLWQAEEPGLYRQKRQEGYSPTRRILAQQIIGEDREHGLPAEGLDSACGLVQGIAASQSQESDPQTGTIWSELISKKFVGHSEVYNITIHPVHTYFANGILVHNCPFGCGFCGGRSSSMLRRIRLRDTANVVAEIEHLYLTYGVRGFMLNDDELNVNKECVPLMNAIAALAERHGVEFRLRGFVKSELFTDEQAAAMYRAGFRWLLCGFEGGHPRILRNIQKRATVEDNSRMMAIARRHGLKVKALMSIGHPGESEETVLAVRDWLIAERVDDFDCTVITTYPGTPYYDEARDLGGGVWRYEIHGDGLYMEDADFTRNAQYYKGRIGDYKSFVWTDYLDQKQLVALRDQLEQEVRKALGIPFNPTGSSVRYEASMGQLPGHVLRSATQ